MKKLAITLAVLLVMSVASVASADVMLKEVKVDPGTVVTIYDGFLASPGNIDVLTGNYVVAIDPGGSPNISGTFYGYCVDPGNSNTSPSPYALLPVTGMTSMYKAAAWILGQGYTGATAVAAQLAVWELVWDAGTVDLAAGNFRLPGRAPGDALYDAASGIITSALANYAGQDYSLYYVAVSPSTGLYFNVDYQDYIIKTPIPAAVWLLGSALLGLVGIRRRMTS